MPTSARRGTAHTKLPMGAVGMSAPSALITRKQLNPCQARAVQAMLDRHPTEQRAADVLGWSINRVVARVEQTAHRRALPKLRLHQ